MNKENLPEAVAYLFDTATIRERCRTIFNIGCENKLRYWHIDLHKLNDAAQLVISEIKGNYPDLDVPYHGRWRHINAGDIDRIKQCQQLFPPEELPRALFELTLISVLLDAGAGMQWHFFEEESGQTFSKSEGLAVASFAMFRNGDFAEKASVHLRVSGKALAHLSVEQIAHGFQVSEENPLVGLEGRTHLLQILGQMITAKGYGFEQGQYLGELYDHITAQAQGKNLSAKTILRNILIALGPIWPGRLILNGYNVGDTWEHYALHDQEKLPGLIPFHKLSQWLTYSLLEVFESAGYYITELEALTGLPEYRNGGLFMDTGVLSLKDRLLTQQRWRASDELIIEWRALTVVLLDEVAKVIRHKLGTDEATMPLAKILQGGTWSAGRKLAKEKRVDGGSPLHIVSDGTVF